jgi:hypothetical protein
MLSEQEKELWVRYQNEVATPVSAMTMDELNQFIDQCENTVFEAKAKQAKAMAERQVRKAEAAKMDRDKLISNPKYSPSDSPTLKSPLAHAKEKKAKAPKKADISNAMFGDMADLIAEAKAKKAALKADGESK